MKEQSESNGRRGGTRTPDPRIRNPLLYPPELHARGYLQLDNIGGVAPSQIDGCFGPSEPPSFPPCGLKPSGDRPRKRETIWQRWTSDFAGVTTAMAFISRRGAWAMLGPPNPAPSTEGLKNAPVS